MSYQKYEELDLQVLPHTIKRLKDDLEPDVKHHIYQHFINTSDTNEAYQTAYEHFWMQMHAIILSSNKNVSYSIANTGIQKQLRKKQQRRKHQLRRESTS
ncbi:hypothetical protein DFH28DRAFT_1137859 [Melampsora americana]|nr:hypothetical protein DFH28DRAFT_1141509 [Melampsora americana]KAH9807799.1 hypothetical protein DFH28DRAFT_1137859 [Melampsora americana]